MFRGLRRTVQAILTLALILAFPVTASATDAGFSDVPETAPYHDSVVYLSERQIVTGTGVGQFSPDAPITVRQWAVMLCRAYGVQMKGNGWMEQSQSGVDAACGNGWLSETAVVSPETQLCRSAVLESAFDAAQIPVYDNVLYGGKALSREENVLRVGQELGLCSASSTVSERVTRGEAAVYLYETLTHQFAVEAPKSPVVCENRSDTNLNDYLMELRYLPDTVLNAFNEHGWKLVIDHEYTAKMGKLYNVSCTGVTSYQERTIYVSEAGAVLHEFGHFIEGALLSFPARSQELFNTEAKDAPFRSYAKTSSNEYFADYFAYLLTHSDGSKSMQLLKKSTPKTYEYFHSLTINGEPLLGGSHAEEVKNY